MIPKRNRHSCPRRMEEMGDWDRVENQDSWSPRHGLAESSEPACSFCGSIPPARFMELIEAGSGLVPIDKYFARLSGVGQFYYQHLSREQRRRFVELLNHRRVSLDVRSHWVLPFFCHPIAH